MKQLSSAFFLFMFITNAFASSPVQLGASDSISSAILKEKRPYMVYLPPSYETSDRNYPVIYLLDGDVHRFKGFVGVLEALSTGTLENQVEQAIVIAIPNTNRSRDLTPSVLKEWTFKGRVLDSFEQTGQAHTFSRFLKNELIPTINSKYRTSHQKVLVGESFGGLFASYALLHSSSVFSDYLIIDPTALWDDNYLNRTIPQNLNNASQTSNVFFAFANNEHLGEIGKTNYKWGSEFAANFISKTSGRARQQQFNQETHGTVALLGWYTGLTFLLPNKS